MKQSYNILLNSMNGVGLLTSNKTYTFDPNLLPDGAYEVTFSFVSYWFDSSLPRAGFVYCDLGQSNVYEAKASGNNLSTFLGILKPNEKSTNSFIRIGADENPSVYLKSKPSSSTINVRLLADDGTASPFTEFVRYAMTLHFQLL